MLIIYKNPIYIGSNKMHKLLEVRKIYKVDKMRWDDWIEHQTFASIIFNDLYGIFWEKLMVQRLKNIAIWYQ